MSRKVWMCRRYEQQATMLSSEIISSSCWTVRKQSGCLASDQQQLARSLFSFFNNSLPFVVDQDDRAPFIFPVGLSS